MAMKFYFRDMEGYKDLTEHQKKYVGKSGSSRVMVGKKYPQPQCLC